MVPAQQDLATGSTAACVGLLRSFSQVGGVVPTAAVWPLHPH